MWSASIPHANCWNGVWMWEYTHSWRARLTSLGENDGIGARLLLEIVAFGNNMWHKTSFLCSIKLRAHIHEVLLILEWVTILWIWLTNGQNTLPKNHCWCISMVDRRVGGNDTMEEIAVDDWQNGCEKREGKGWDITKRAASIEEMDYHDSGETVLHFQ